MSERVRWKWFDSFENNCLITRILLVPIVGLVIVLCTFSVLWVDSALLWFSLILSWGAGCVSGYRCGKLMGRIMPWKPEWRVRRPNLLFSIIVLLMPFISLRGFIVGGWSVDPVVVGLIVAYSYFTFFTLFILARRLDKRVIDRFENQAVMESRITYYLTFFFFLFPLFAVITFWPGILPR